MTNKEVAEKIIAENPLPITETSMVHYETTEEVGEGSYTQAQLELQLAHWEENIEGFEYESTVRRNGFRVWCPGNQAEGWPDGEAHQDVRSELTDDTIVFVENGFPCFSCFHNHCAEGSARDKKTWKHFREYWDPDNEFWLSRDPVTDQEIENYGVEMLELEPKIEVERLGVDVNKMCYRDPGCQCGLTHPLSAGKPIVSEHTKQLIKKEADAEVQGKPNRKLRLNRPRQPRNRSSST